MLILASKVDVLLNTLLQGKKGTFSVTFMFLQCTEQILQWRKYMISIKLC